MKENKVALMVGSGNFATSVRWAARYAKFDLLKLNGCRTKIKGVSDGLS